MRERKADRHADADTGWQTETESVTVRESKRKSANKEM